MQVEIMQYLLPDGKQRAGMIEVSDECAQKLEEIVECGGRLTCELLSTNVVSQTIEIVDADCFDYDITLTNGSDGEAAHRKALEEMIMRFDKAKCREAVAEES